MATPVSYTSFKGTVLKESEKAVLFRVTEISGSPLDKSHDHWFPLSRIAKRFTNPNEANQDTMMIESWLCDKFCEQYGI